MDTVLCLLAALGQVDLPLSPLWQHVIVDDIAEVDLIASADAAESFSAVDAIISWDPAALELLGAVPSGYPWMVQGFLNDPDGINTDVTDGEALFTALASPFTPASVPPDIVVTTFRFRVLGDGNVRLLESLGVFGQSRVIGITPGEVVTGEISGPVFVTTVPGTWADLGGGISGIQGVPDLLGEGPLRAYSPLDLTLTLAPPSAFALLWISFVSVPVNYFGGTLYAVPFAEQVLLVTDPTGTIAGSVLFPPFVPGGTELYFQYICQDFSTVQDLTFSNAVRATTP